jgi:hypothetical protein
MASEPHENVRFSAPLLAKLFSVSTRKLYHNPAFGFLSNQFSMQLCSLICRTIDTAGSTAGFILAAGCSLLWRRRVSPADAKEWTTGLPAVMLGSYRYGFY